MEVGAAFEDEIAEDVVDRDPARPVAGGDLQPLDLLLLLAQLEAVADGNREPLGIDGLGQEIDGAQLDGGDGVPDGLGRGDDQDGKFRVGLVHGPEEIQARSVGEGQIEQGEIGGIGRDAVEEVPSGADGLQAVAFGLEEARGTRTTEAASVLGIKGCGLSRERNFSCRS